MIIETSEGQAVLLQNLARLELKEGDRLVLMTDQVLSSDQAMRFAQLMRAALGVEIIVLDGGMKAAVLGGVP